MIYIVAALYCEGKPFIDYYNLKRMDASGRFQIFSNDDVALIVTGVGPFSAAIGTTYLLSLFKATRRDGIINIGICGSKGKEFSKGEAVLCNKIIHHDTQREYYPDLLLKYPFRECTLETFSRPVDESLVPFIKGDIVDMEGAGVFEAASVFLPVHKIFFIKVISDFLKVEKISHKAVSSLIEGVLPDITELMDNLIGLNKASFELLSPKEKSLLQRLSNHLYLSVTMRHRLTSMAKGYKAFHNKDLSCLEPFLSVACDSKKEGKKYFEQIRKTLME